MRWCKSLDNSPCTAETHRIFSIQNSTQCATANFANLRLLDASFFSPPLQNAIRLHELLQSAARITNCFWTKISATAVQRRQVLYRASASLHGKIQAYGCSCVSPTHPPTNNGHTGLLFRSLFLGQTQIQPRRCVLPQRKLSSGRFVYRAGSEGSYQQQQHSKES